jgi:hypothetical protein
LKSSNQVTISRHTLLDKSQHFDLFLDTGGDTIITYEVVTSSLDLPIYDVLECVRKQDHRRIYLEYQGEISNQRGFISIVWRGEYKNKKSIGNTKIEILLLEELLYILD